MHDGSVCRRLQIKWKVAKYDPPSSSDVTRTKQRENLG